jgi:hypothetical protein
VTRTTIGSVTSIGTALRRTIILVVLAAGVGALVSSRRGQTGVPVPSAPPQWPPLPVRTVTEVQTTLPSLPTPSPTTPPAVAAGWVSANDDGTAPATHPIKLKASSGIFHVPGGRFYDRTTPDHCYATAADAEADGYRQSKS